MSSIMAHFAASVPRKAATRDPLFIVVLKHTRLLPNNLLKTRIQVAITNEMRKITLRDARNTLIWKVEPRTG